MNHDNHRSNSFWPSWIMVGILSLSIIYLIGYHGVHLTAFLPLAFLLGCAAMHLFMHHGHGSHDSNNNQDHQNH